MYNETTRAVSITVQPFFVDEQSSPDQGRWVFGYQVCIENQSQETVQLLTRHWKITDSFGRLIEVKGEGVVGEQPVLAPGESFEYTSGTPLGSESGFMMGSYQMVTEQGERFDAAIPPFSLDAPGAAAHAH